MPSFDDSQAELLVSVVLPTFNRGHVIGRAIESVRRQSYPHIELIIVDDASTDDTAAHVTPWLSPRLRLIRCARNGGANLARNAGIAASTGRFVAFLDSDDEWEADKIALQVARFRAGPAELGLVYTGILQIVPGRSPVVVRPRLRGHVFDSLRARNGIGTASTVMVRREVLADVGGFDARLRACEDWDLWLRIARSYSVDGIDAPCVRYHDGAGDQLSARARRVFISDRIIFKRYNLPRPSRRALGLHLALLARELYRLGRYRSACRFAWAALRQWPDPELAPAIALRASARLLLGERLFARVKPLRRSLASAGRG